MITISAFRQHLLRCFSKGVPDKMMVALSGGVDSMCLTYLLHQYKEHYQPTMEIHAMTIDHQYRLGSYAEAQDVGRIVEKWGVLHSIEQLTYASDVHVITNFEELARTMRYQTFQKACKEREITSLFVAHNLNDQLETYLQRLLMNSTLYGLAGLRPYAPFPAPQKEPYNSITVHRPLLRFDKSLIRETCVENGVEWFEDATNADIHLTKRNMLRYLINEYVPMHSDARSDLKTVNKLALVETTSEIEGSMNLLESRIYGLDNYLKQYGSFLFDEKNAQVSFELPIEMWRNLHQLVFSRWLYDIMYSISSAKHFHWSYAKIERQAFPRIADFLETEDPNLQVTYLNVIIKVERDGKQVRFRLSKQPALRHELRDISQSIEVTSVFLQWVLFDRTWWIRVRSDSLTKVYVKPYALSLRRSIARSFPGCTKVSPNIPIIVDIHGTVLAIPTHGLSHESIDIDFELANRVDE